MERLKKSCLLVAMFFSTAIEAQFVWAEVGVNGLTCSQCSRNVEMSIKKLAFVSGVDMNLEQTKARITFEEGSKIDVLKISKAVFEAGFSVRYFFAGFNFNNISVSEVGCFEYEKDVYQFIKVQNQKFEGEKTLKFIGKEFLPKKEFKREKRYLQRNCEVNNRHIYYVTL